MAGDHRRRGHHRTCQRERDTEHEALPLARTLPQRSQNEAISCDQLVPASQELSEPLALLGGEIACPPLRVGLDAPQAAKLFRPPRDRGGGVREHLSLARCEERVAHRRCPPFGEVEPEVVGGRKDDEARKWAVSVEAS